MTEFPLTVAIITGEYPPNVGGVGDYTALLRGALATNGVRSLVVCFDNHGADSPDVVRIKPQWPRSYRALRAALGHAVPDVIHIQFQTGAFQMRPSVQLLPLVLRQQLGRPVVTTFHDLRAPYLFPKAGRLRTESLKVMARTSSAVIATNPADVRTLRRWGLTANTIPIGPNLPSPSDGIQPIKGTLGFFGLPTRSKGILALLNALATLDPAVRPTLRLIGASGVPGAHNDVLAPEVIDRIARFHGVTITRTGFVSPERASAELAACAAIALPFAEGASLRSGSLLAALQSGRPVISTVPEHPEDLAEIARLSQLLLVPRCDIRALSRAIRDALNMEVWEANLPDRFQWPSIAQAHAALYARLVGCTR